MFIREPYAILTLPKKVVTASRLWVAQFYIAK